ncbi:hypothetical protein K1T35_47440 (plasmid) [Pseudonocardia sp. DSM 110487]|uniref:hypothetical protein n=1 Tax=Pseudonocardia sp. DSM 110487 TaxID=2865833 RepID=UPI001C696F83|nr:hypothetical protein [Pseudonocardia sp. DSM 110487]QYN40984.1 hypothetical protein K1T35_47440 [Pseudonocardia sp. DSM 110487]
MAGFALRTLVGHVNVAEEFADRQYYEVAAWSREHKIQPGTYPVYVSGDVNYQTGRLNPYWVHVTYDTIIADEDFTPLFAGVPIGPTRKDGVGERDTHSVQLYAYQFPAELADNGPRPVKWLGGTFTPLPRITFTPAVSVNGERRYGTHVQIPEDLEGVTES